ncbi:MAG: type IV pilin N-terminal domain-containing protein [Gammaproteobacteria bacterium]|nr:type IV pilin N-terminal domain-containing protein [Gammaproteobacteria bacterium]
MKVALKPTFKDSDNATSPVFGAMLIILLTFVLAVASVAAVYNDGAIERISNAFTKTPAAVIEIENIENYGSEYHDINIKLWHKGGDSLLLDSTTMILSGKGTAYSGFFPIFTEIEGDVVVKYLDLTKFGKYPAYNTNNPSLDDGLWSTGEQLILNGDDSILGTDASSVLVSANGISNTSNNYGFDTDTTVTIKIFDKTTKRIIAEGTAIVKPAE